jgi:hypothetical protein
MAYIGTTGDGGNVYNVNYAVGTRAPNKRDDVLLVQWMLHRVFTDHPSFVPPDADDLAIDGWIGPRTVKWIKAFQVTVRRFGRPCALDGRVDSARKSEGSVSKAPYTILWLNGELLVANPTVFSDPSIDPDMPPELLSALATNDGSTGPYIATVSDGPVPGDVYVPVSGGI